MRIRTYTDSSAYRDRVWAMLEAEEATNGLMLGLLSRFVRDTEPVEEERRPFLALAEHEGQIPLAMVMTPPRNLILYGTGDHLDAAIEAAVSFLLQEDVPVPGVMGPREVATQFSSAWSQHTGCSVAVEMEQMIYQLDEVNNVPLSPGELILATPEHVDLLTDWIVDFARAAHEVQTRDGAREHAERVIDAARLYLWNDGVPVSMSWRTRPTRHGIAVSGVYTPPERRNRGYATSCVASLSKLLLAEGYQFCMLYTDLANPTSNSIYRKIGYYPVRASVVYSFA